jgi:PPOX class probable FMN-dependent enzyme
MQDSTITTIEQLVALHKEPSKRAQGKELSQLELHTKRFIELSPFLVLSSADAKGRADASPRGGAPGFVKLASDTELLIPDAPGNNRLDSLRNIIETRQVGLLFLLPGVEETLRINGSAELSTDPALLARFDHENWNPKLVIKVRVETLYMHCAKALLRSRLWEPETRIERSAYPTMGEVLKDHLGQAEPAESHADMLARYAQDL